MEKIHIICIDDQRNVLNALVSDLQLLESHYSIEECESATEAWDLIDEIYDKGNFVGLIITDHVMPENTGVDFLKKLKMDGRFESTKKVLLTGQATHQDTIEAINSTGLNHYIEKPWDKEKLLHIVKSLLTTFLVEVGLEYKEYLEVIDSDTLYQLLKNTTG
ncbi:MAG: response regulator [Cyclobacteriaceae bacterium]